MWLSAFPTDDTGPLATGSLCLWWKFANYAFFLHRPTKTVVMWWCNGRLVDSTPALACNSRLSCKLESCCRKIFFAGPMTSSMTVTTDHCIMTNCAYCPQGQRFARLSTSMRSQLCQPDSRVYLPADQCQLPNIAYTEQWFTLTANRHEQHPVDRTEQYRPTLFETVLSLWILMPHGSQPVTIEDCVLWLWS